MALPQGCQSLTKRLWNKSEMTDNKSKLNDYKIWQKNNDISTLYIGYKDLSGSKKLVKIHTKFIDFGNLKPHLPKGCNLLLWDFSRVSPEKRVITEYDFLIMRQDNARKFDSIEAHFIGYLFSNKAVFIDSLPDDIIEVPGLSLKSVELTEWSPMPGDTIFDKSVKVILTPFTLVADLIVVPVCYSCMWIRYIYIMKDFRS